MSHVVIEPVATKRQRQQFLEFPWTLYRGDPNWIPPLRDNQRELTGFSKNPFYEYNRVQTFLASRDGEVVGRIAAILNQGHIDRYQDRRGFFGFFDCRDDQEAAHGLFEAVRQWFSDRGIYQLRGPVNPSLNHELGLLIEGFHSPPTFMMTYNPPYYQGLVESFGFTKAQDLYAYMGTRDMLPEVERKLGPISKQIIEYTGITLRPLDRKRFRADVHAFLSIYNRSLANTWGFVPMSQHEVEHTAKSLQYLIVPELSIAAELNGEMIGAVFGLPDFNPRIKEIDGRLFPFGFIHLLRNKQQIPRIRLISTNVLPEYQRMGVGLALMAGLAPQAIAWGVQEAEFSWVLESNLLSRGSLEKGGTKRDKVFRVYDLAFEPTGAAPSANSAGENSVGRPAVECAAQIVKLVAEQVEVRPVTTEAGRRDFVRLPWRIYDNDPVWVPPLEMQVREAIDPRAHPFYLHGAAQPMVAYLNGQPVARLVVSDDPNYNQAHGERVACFGMFETINEPVVCGRILDAAAQWARERGLNVLRGPIDYSVNYPCGLLIDGYNQRPVVMTNHNPPYYRYLLEVWGLEKVRDLYAWDFQDPNTLLGKWKDRIEKIMRRAKLTIRPARADRIDEEIALCRGLYNESHKDLWGFVHLTDAEFRWMARDVARLCDPRQVLLAEIEGKPIGMCITLPDLNAAIQPLGGRLAPYGLPINLARLYWRMRRVSGCRLMVLDVIQEYRRRGVADLLIYYTLLYGREMGQYNHAELSWTLEDNDAVNRVIEAVGGRKYKTYRIYQKAIG